jgi:hypothetical protein
VLDANGFPQLSYPPVSNRPPGTGPLYVSPAASGLVDGPLTQACDQPTTVAGLACGDYGVNTMQPTFKPSGAFGAVLPRQTTPTIGDRLSGKGRTASTGPGTPAAGRTPTATSALRGGRTAPRPPRPRPVASTRTSILATIETRWELKPVATRDGEVNDLAHVFDAKKPK